MRTLFLALSLALLVSCTVPVEPSTPKHFVQTVYADQGTPLTLRWALYDASAHLEDVSEGRIRVGFDFSANFLDEGELWEHAMAGSTLLYYVDSDTEMVRRLDGRNGAPILGAVTRGGYGTRIVLVQDRLARWGTRALRSVVLHELGHLAGLPHTEKRGAVMSSEDRSFLVRFTETDLELCRSEGLCP